MDPKQKIFSHRLKELRKGKKLTQDDLAKELGLAKTSISGYERGERYPEFNMISKIADFFGKPIDYLMGKSDLNESIDDEFVSFLYNIKDSNIDNLISTWFKDASIDYVDNQPQYQELDNMLYGFIKLLHALLKLPVRDDKILSDIKMLLIAIVSMQGNKQFSPNDYKNLISLVPYFYNNYSLAKLTSMTENERMNLINLNESMKQLTYNEFNIIMDITHTLKYYKVTKSFVESDRTNVNNFINYELGAISLDKDTKSFFDIVNSELEACTKLCKKLIAQINNIRQNNNLSLLPKNKEGDTT